MPAIGYGSDKKTKHCCKDHHGFKKLLVHNMRELEVNELSKLLLRLLWEVVPRCSADLSFLQIVDVQLSSRSLIIKIVATKRFVFMAFVKSKKCCVVKSPFRHETF